MHYNTGMVNISPAEALVANADRASAGVILTDKDNIQISVSLQDEFLANTEVKRFIATL